MRITMRKLLFATAILAGGWLSFAAGAGAASPEGMRLYVFSSGWLGPLDKSLLQTGGAGKAMTETRRP